MSAVLNFDASQVAPDTGAQDALPAGWYDVLIEASEMKPTKGGDGAYLELKFNVIAPQQFAGKKTYGRLNLRNSNATAQEIGYKQLSAICHATGILQVADSAQLHNIPMKIKLKLRKPDGEYDASNDITAYKNINEQVQLASGVAVAGAFPGQAPAPQYAPPAFAVPPSGQAPQPPFQPQAGMAGPGGPVPQQQFAPPVQQQAPQQAPQQAWQPPAAQQPWQAPQQPTQQAPQMPQQQFAPPPAQQPQQQFAPQVQQQQQFAPPVQQQQAPNPAAQQAQTAVPPWMQQPQTA